MRKKRAKPRKNISQKPEVKQPQEHKQSNQGVVESHTVAHSLHFSGPIPPPVFMAEYEKALPSLSNRVMVAFEKQQQHSITTERKLFVYYLVERSVIWVSLFVLLGIGIWFLVEDRNTIGISVGGISILVLMFSFVTKMIVSPDVIMSGRESPPN